MKLFKAYLWFEALTFGYLLFRKEPVLDDSEKKTVSDLESQLKEKIDATQKP